jgi:hypothetical protein
MNRLICLSLALCAALALATPASATTIYYDSFTHPDDTPFTDGRTTPVTYLPVEVGGQNWSSQWAMLVLNNSACVGGSPTNGMGQKSAFLPFTPQNGKVYNLSMDVNNTDAGSADFIDFGFAATNDAIGTLPFVNDTTYGITEVAPGSSGDTYCFTDIASTPLGWQAGSGSLHNYGVQLDTTGGAGNWKVSYYIDGALQTYLAHADGGPSYQNVTGSSFALPAGTVINYVGFGGATSTAFGFVDNFSLTVTPEPSTLVLLSMGLVSLLAYAWRKRK